MELIEIIMQSLKILGGIIIVYLLWRANKNMYKFNENVCNGLAEILKKIKEMK